MGSCLHVEFGQANCTESMAAVDHDPRDMIFCVEVFRAKGALLLIEQLADKLVYLFAI